VLFSTVPRLERYAQAFGAGIPEKDVPYGTAAEELLGLGLLSTSRHRADLAARAAVVAGSTSASSDTGMGEGRGGRRR